MNGRDGLLITSQNKTWLILDNYGDEWLPSTMYKRIVGASKLGIYLAIDKITGEIYTSSFHPEGKKYIVMLCELNCSVTKEYIMRLDELKSKKRPFYLGLDEAGWLLFTDREIGYGSLNEYLVVDLDFRPTRLQIFHDSYREVSNWKKTND